MEEFAEIGRSGQIIEFVTLADGRRVQTLINTSGKKLVMIGLAASPQDGKIIDLVSFRGIGQPMIYKQPSVLVSLFSDDQGFFGRTCPQCKSYFRTGGIPSKTYCPYCGHEDSLISFCTENQNAFVAEYVKEAIRASNSREKVSINLDELADSLPTNIKSPWIYKEEIQQTRFECTQCKLETDILGEYGICPRCGIHNCTDIIDKKLVLIEERFKEVDETTENRHAREVEWERLLRCVSEFEGLANELRKFLLRTPLAQKRRADLNNLSFQKILNANERISDWFGFQILENIDADSRTFINIMFNKRHLFTHNNGRVDQEYLNNTNDTKLRLNELVRFRSNEIRRLLPLIRQMSTNLTKGYLSITAL